MTNKITHDITRNTNSNAFAATLAMCKPNDWIIYSRGPTVNGPHKAIAMASYAAGNVALVQRKIKANYNRYDFEYIAVRLDPKTKA